MSITLQERVAQLVLQHGGLRAAGRAVDIDPGYLHRLAEGDRARPSKLLLKRMGLRELRVYELLKEPKPSQAELSTALHAHNCSTHFHARAKCDCTRDEEKP